MLDNLLGPALSELVQQEDAFTLRVQAPAGADGLPVVFFIPGGGFTTGSGESRWYESPTFVRDARIVLVTVNYRLGVSGHFGPLGDPAESTKPVRDLQAALEWVRENISSFGGDPGRTTIAGDSAGAWYAYALSTDPRMRGLAARTLLISMPRLAPLPVDIWLRHRAAVIDAVGSETSLLTAPVEALLAAQGRARAGLQAFPYMPAESQETPSDLARYASSAQRIHTDAVLLITTAEESAGFLRNQPRTDYSKADVERFIERTFTDPARVAAFLQADDDPDAYLCMVRAATLAQFRTSALEIATNAPVSAQVVRLDHRSKLEAAYAPHCFVLPFIFGDVAQWRDSPMLDGASMSESARVTAAMRKLVTDFVYRGVTTSDRFDPLTPQTLRLDADGIRLEPALEAGLGVRETDSK
ncbi:carboxylesterase family protein [Arthrobacter sp. I3]|jgi:para-nitrobenzyl esterase|uniref:carboxylesterase family protein n=1 Tax=Arthrobacter sp. I3 TaxID=218158 RepID=UPI0004854E87|nr:carboxylesterase family protein [Arthrobacter sp. I3]